MRRLTLALLAAAPLWLAACDQLGIESAAATNAKREAEGKAIGAGCRHAARSVEVCYDLNKKADKAAVFAGWRDMNDYMRENKLDAQPAPAEKASAVASADEAADDEEVKPKAKAGDKNKADGKADGKAEGKADAKAEAKAEKVAAKQ